LSAQNVNGSSWLAVNFTSEILKDSHYTHSNVTNPARIYVNETGWYKVTYNISYEVTSFGLRNIHTAVGIDGSSLLSCGHDYSVAYGLSNRFGACGTTALFYINSGSYIQIGARGEGGSGTVNTLQDGQTWILIEKARNNY
jgi:hypothetical protein